MENPYLCRVTETCTPLASTTESEAMEEARGLWAHRLAQGTYKACMNEEVIFPNSPILRCDILLEEPNPAINLDSLKR